MLRGKSQVRRINDIIIPIITKVSHKTPGNFHKHAQDVRMSINTTHQDETQLNVEIVLIIEQEVVPLFDEQYDHLYNSTKKNIPKIISENRKTYNKNVDQVSNTCFVAIKKERSLDQEKNYSNIYWLI